MNQNHSGYSGAGFVDKLEAAGAGVTFYAKVANAGDYDVTFRYANGDAAERSLSVYVNGAYIGKTIMPSTGHWDTWADCLMQLPLAAGNNIITLKHEDASRRHRLCQLGFLHCAVLSGSDHRRGRERRALRHCRHKSGSLELQRKRLC